MQGVFYRRPSGHLDRLSHKRDLKAQAKAHPETIIIEATALAGVEYGGPALEMPEGQTIYIVGPDPHTNRRWYAQMRRKGDQVTVV
jgi:hypothetical protein